MEKNLKSRLKYQRDNLLQEMVEMALQGDKSGAQYYQSLVDEIQLRLDQEDKNKCTCTGMYEECEICWGT